MLIAGYTILTVGLSAANSKTADAGVMLIDDCLAVGSTAANSNAAEAGVTLTDDCPIVGLSAANSNADAAFAMTMLPNTISFREDSSSNIAESGVMLTLGNTTVAVGVSAANSNIAESGVMLTDGYEILTVGLSAANSNAAEAGVIVTLRPTDWSAPISHASPRASRLRPSMSISTPVGVVPKSTPAPIAREFAIKCKSSDPLLVLAMVFAAVAPSELVTLLLPHAVVSSDRL